MTSKIEVGDKVHVEFTVTDVIDHDQSEIKLLKLEGESTIAFFSDSLAIVKHLPKPYEPERGDIVSYMGGCSHLKVIAVDYSGRAWCRDVHTKNERLYEFNVLTFVSKG